MKSKYFLLILLTAISTFHLSASQASPAKNKKNNWQILQKGLHLGVFTVSNPFTKKTASIRILKINSKYFQFKLINASQTKLKQNKSAKSWAKQHKLVAAINASMFDKDNSSSSFYMQNGSHLNNAKITKANSFFVFNRNNENLSEATLMDKQCNRVNKIRTQYQAVIQSIRMLSCLGKNVWSKKDLFWSAALLGQDKAGYILFIHVRDPFRMFDLVNKLRALNINISRLMYLEGGPEAQLYVNTATLEKEWLGSYETNFNENDNNHRAWEIPNVLGIVSKGPK